MAEVRRAVLGLTISLWSSGEAEFDAPIDAAGLVANLAAYGVLRSVAVALGDAYSKLRTVDGDERRCDALGVRPVPTWRRFLSMARHASVLLRERHIKELFGACLSAALDPAAALAALEARMQGRAPIPFDEFVELLRGTGVDFSRID